MSFDNIQFNVNGHGIKALTDCLSLALRQRIDMTAEESEADRFTYAGYRFDPKHGLLLYSAVNPGVTAFLSPVDVATCALLVNSWLQTSLADAVELKGWDAKYKGDASSSKGWRVYSEAWGFVGEDQNWGLVCVVTPSYLWRGK